MLPEALTIPTPDQVPVGSAAIIVCGPTSEHNGPISVMVASPFPATVTVKVTGVPIHVPTEGVAVKVESA